MANDQGPALSSAQINALVQSMLSTAQVDGLHPKEEALIRTFYDEQRLAGMPAFEAIPAGGSLAGLGSDAAFADQLVLMCLMAGYADGHLTDAERDHVTALAQQVGVAGERLAGLLQQVQDSLLGSLAHLPDAESVAALAKEL